LLQARNANETPIFYIACGRLPYFLLDAGIYPSIVSKYAINNEIITNLITLKKLNKIDFKRNYYIIYHKDKFIYSALQELINLLKTWETVSGLGTAKLSTKQM
jgi:hypothetical protein